MHRFERFELDVACRQLRLDGVALALQPRVFDVLLYLVENRDRVVSKDELFQAVWPGVIVSDGSLKRAVSLARSALKQGDLEEALKSYSRKGYRFECGSLSAQPPGDGGLELREAQRAFSEGRWLDAVQLFGVADGLLPLTSLELERLAEALQLAGDALSARAPLERAIAAYGALGDARGVARVATALSLIAYEQAQLSVAQGWIRRAQAALPREPVCPEHGLIATMEARLKIAGGDFEGAMAAARRGMEVGRSLGDLDAQVLSMAYWGMALVTVGEIEQGVAAHDEAAALVLSGNASPMVGGIVYCGLIWTCRNRGDCGRAREWSELFYRWCAERSVELHSGSCRLHHAEVLHYQGNLLQAERVAHEACELLARVGPYAQGEAWRVLGDLKLRLGDLDAAESAYVRANELGCDPQPGYAEVLLAKGRGAAALRALGRSLSEANWSHFQRRALLLSGLVKVAVACEEWQKAEEAVRELDEQRERWDTPSHRAIVSQTRALLLQARGDSEAAISQLRRAISEWSQVGTWVHLTEARLKLARLYLTIGDGEACALELSAVAARPTEQLTRPLLEELESLRKELSLVGA